MGETHKKTVLVDGGKAIYPLSLWSLWENTGLAAHIGGMIVEVHVDHEGTVTRCRNEFVPFYRTVKNDYLNWK